MSAPAMDTAAHKLQAKEREMQKNGSFDSCVRVVDHRRKSLFHVAANTPIM
jgi:hypothetical protein